MMEIVYRKLSDIKPNPKNPRKSTPDDIQELAQSIKDNMDFFEARPILLSDRTGKLVIIGGEQRYKAAKSLGMKKAPTILFSGLSEEREDEIMNRDNTHAGVWDEAKLKSWSNDQLASWGVPEDVWETEKEKDNSLVNPYSTKLTSPIYEIRGDYPGEEEIINTEKVDALLAEINKSNVPEKVKKLLRISAYRHAVIDFELMAEYYAHAPKDVQELMEHNALVIIDYEDAIANGFVKLRKDMDEIYNNNLGGEDGEE